MLGTSSSFQDRYSGVVFVELSMSVTQWHLHNRARADHDFLEAGRVSTRVVEMDGGDNFCCCGKGSILADPWHDDGTEPIHGTLDEKLAWHMGRKAAFKAACLAKGKGNK